MSARTDHRRCEEMGNSLEGGAMGLRARFEQHRVVDEEFGLVETYTLRPISPHNARGLKPWERACLALESDQHAT